MSTETTKDAVINTGGVPENEQANLSVATSSTGTTISNTGTVSGLSSEVTGSVVATGGTFTSSVFTFGTPSGSSAPSLTVRNSTLSGTTILGGSTSDSYTLGGSGSSAKSKATTKSTDTMADFGEGADSVSFLKKSLDKRSTYKMEGGEDSITFGKKSVSKRSTVKLGNNDNAGDVVDIHKKAEVKKLKVTEFGKEDTLKIGGKTFDYDKLQDRDGHVGKNITIKFD